MSKRLILLLNMGGADDLSQVKVFLKNMFNDPYILGVPDFLRPILAALITQMRLRPATQNYLAIGSKSPIGGLTRSLVKKLNEAVSRVGEGTKSKTVFDYAMNYTPPFAADTLKKHADAAEIVLLPLYPHHSQTTILSSVEAALNAIKELRLTPKITIMPPFYDDERFNKIIINAISDSAKNTDTSDTHLVFSAHSLPQKIIDAGDLYEEHLKRQVQLLSAMLGAAGLHFKGVHLAYQSRLGPVKWLGPNLSELLPTLAPKKAIIYPISFCVDNSETDFELAIEYAHLAVACGFEHYSVVKAPNDGDDFVEFIVGVVK